jgi:hypothetical protein
MEKPLTLKTWVRFPPALLESSEAWKRLEFVAAETKTFYDDTAVKAAMMMLDWRKKKWHSSSPETRTISTGW